jgi:uncharacterized Rossmann fold enzyme
VSTVNFDEWEPVYERVLADFGFPRAADEAARDELARLTDPHAFDRDRLGVLTGETVVVAGAGPSLPAEIDRIACNDIVIGASTAVDVLHDAGVTVELMTTDLDKNAGTVRRLADRGVPVAVHAHGDNRDLLHETVPEVPAEHLFATTQAAPADGIENLGGFTDGDRAAFLADHAGAAALKFVGWDFDDPAVSPTKRRKLAWAATLLRWLERRRGERFSVLNDRREAIDTESLPID